MRKEAGGQPVASGVAAGDPVSQLQACLADEFPWEQMPTDQLLAANRLAHALIHRLGKAMERRNLASEQRFSLRDIECQSISRALACYGNNFSLAARALGIARSTLYRKVKEYGLS